MFLKSIHLKNVRGFTDHELSFEDPDVNSGKLKPRKTTILLGDNGTGKSNLLKAIGLVTAGRNALPELLGDPESWIQVRKRSCEITAVIQNQAGQEHELHLAIKKGDELSDVLDRAKETTAALDDALEHTNRSYFTLAYGPSRRLNVNRERGSKSSLYRHVRAQNVGTLFNVEATLTPIESWAMDMDYRKNRGAMQVIKTVMSDFLAGVKFARIDKKQGRLMFKTSHGIVPMNQLSDGYQNVAAWIGDLLYRTTNTFDDYKSPLKTRGLLLIDEIDLHLHPHWQRQLLGFLSRKLPNFQVVATTHSPVTAQQAGENELHYLQQRGKTLSLHQFDAMPQSLLLHQLLMSDAFGIASDESEKMEKKKARFEKLAKTKQPSKAQQAEFRKLKSELDRAPRAVRSNASMNQRHADLLRAIHDELEAGKS